MSDYETRELSGALFANNYKEPGDNRPDFTGNCKIDGAMYRIAGWKKKSARGKTFLSLALTMEDDGFSTTDKRPADQVVRESDGFDEDIPF